MNEEHLITLVQANQCLYDLQHKDYDDNAVKENIWKEIAEELNTTSEVCKNKWTNLRSYYRKVLARRKTTSGQAAKKIKRWRFEDQMEFLKCHMQDRTTKSNLSIESLDTDDNAGENDDIDDAESERSIQDTPTHSAATTTSSHVSSRKRKASEERNKPLATALTKFIESRSEVQKVSAKSKLMQFFEDIAETMSTFTELEQVELKGEIFNLVNKKKIDALRRCQAETRLATQPQNPPVSDYDSNQPCHPHEQHFTTDSYLYQYPETSQTLYRL